MLEHVKTILSRNPHLKLTDALKKLKIEKLKTIPKPPLVYLEWKLAIQRLGVDSAEDIERAKRAFWTKEMKALYPDGQKEIREYRAETRRIFNHNSEHAEFAIAFNTVNFEGEGVSPIAKFEVRERDFKKHGRTEWGLIFDWTARRKGEEEVERVPLFILLNPERWRPWAELKREVVSDAMELGYPTSWEMEKEKEEDERDDTF